MKNFLRNNTAWIFIGIINIIPLIIWSFMMPLNDRFGSSFQIMTSLGQMSALLGFSLVATSIILTSRLRPLEKIFHGLNHVYAKHHLIGSVSLILLMFHPLILAIRYLQISTKSAALFLVPNLTLWPQTLGTISLLIMMALLFITFYLAWTYHLWKFSHRFLTLAFFIGFLHVAFITSDVSTSISLRSYLLILGGLALMAYGYRLLVEFGNFGKYPYLISNIKKLTADIIEISLKPQEKSIIYAPGQFAFLTIKQKGLSGEDHPYSFVGTTDDKEITFAIKALGEYTKSLTNLKAGAQIFVEGPYGTFGQKQNNNIANGREIWIAGGIGITPFICLANDLVNSGRQADLFLTFKSNEEAIYTKELEALAKNNPNLNVIIHYSGDSGRLTADKIEEISNPIINKQIYICGPVSLMRSLRKQFIIKGVKNNNIHSEEFNLV